MLLLIASIAHADTSCYEQCAEDMNTCFDGIDTDPWVDCQEAGHSGTDLVNCVGQAQAQVSVECANYLGECNDRCDENTGGGAGYRVDTESCPDGTTRSPLGACTPVLGESPTDSDPDDGCPAGYIRGEDDRCVPEIDVVPSAAFEVDGNWWVTCPDGTIPGPADACVVDTREWPTDTEACPPGFVTGPDGDCVPNLNTALGRELLAMVTQALDGQGLLDEASVQMLESWGALPTEDVQSTVDQLRNDWQ